ncbi:hypothetical protein ACIPF8_15555 [Collimonas sp. NPDC087041]|uniref:hypothetical protein n=1 Tax=Collimonas sp. NPDC087041 TaxID=3363960 RepID=UPI00380FAA39
MALLKTVATPWKLAGGGPAAAHFLCFAKESKQRKAIAQPLPAFGGFPNEPCASRMGHKLASLKHVSHNSRLSPDSFGNVSMRKVKNNGNGNVKSQFKFKINSNSNVKTTSAQLNGVGVFFSRLFAKITLTPFNEPRSK